MRQQVELEVRQAMVNLTQGRAQVEAANEALKLAGQVLDAERTKLESGGSTTHNVVLRQRDLAAARQAPIDAAVTYANAPVELHPSTRGTLKGNRIEIRDAVTRGIT